MIKYTNIFLIIFSSCFLLLSIGVIFLTLDTAEIKYQPSPIVPYDNTPPTWNPNIENDPSPSRTLNNSIPTDRSVYVMYLDVYHEPTPNHCMMYNQWMSTLIKSDIIDAIEVYSMNGWKHPNCSIKTVSVPSSHFSLKQPTSWLVHKALQMFLTRSKSNYLFLLSHSPFINVTRLEKFLEEYVTKSYEVRASGNCIEYRYFFYMHTIESGILLHRNTIIEALKLESKWEVSDQIGLGADESLGQVLDQVGIYVKHYATPYLIGRPFADFKFYQALMTKNFRDLQKCEIPAKSLESQPGEITSCSTEIIQFNEVAVWAGAQEGKEIWFLENAAYMMKDVPDEVGFYWDKAAPVLCNLSLASVSKRLRQRHN